MRRRLLQVAAHAALVALCLLPADAAFFAPSSRLNREAARIGFHTPTLAPMAHTRFCLQYPADCEVSWLAFFGDGIVELTDARLAQLMTVNRDVNRAIIPQPNGRGHAGDHWLVAPKAGDCNDYAVTKRHELLARGWSSRSLLLAEVVTAGGKHHLVLVVRTNQGDLVLDNLNANVLPLSKTRYQWVRVQSPGNPKYWSTVRMMTA
jgi:predicted transglutaminase-like cysteine proteinase